MNFEAVRKTVLDRKPALKRIIDQYGDGSFLAYAQKRGMSTSTVSVSRQQELLSVFSEEVTRLLGSDVAERATKQLLEDYYVSTAEHHAPVCHPFVVSGTVLQSLAANERGRLAVIVFSCGTISLNNSYFPRGLTYHDGDLVEKRLRLLPWKYRRQSVFAAKPYTRDDMQNMRVEPGFLPFLNSIYDTEQVFAATSFADQISITNYAFWGKMPAVIASELVYVQQEKIVNELLLRYHLENKTIIHELLFNPKWQQSFLKHFDGIVGAFTNIARKGTFLFWGLQDGVRVGLMYDQGRLVSADGFISLELTPAALRVALQNQSLMPGLALSYLVLSFYYGLTLGGGFSQVDYLPTMQRAYIAMLDEIVGETREKIADAVETSYLSADFAFISLNVGAKQTLATALDLLLYGSDEAIVRVKQIAETYPLSLALDNLMPEFYTIVQGGKQPLLMSLGVPLPTSLYVPLSLLRQ